MNYLQRAIFGVTWLTLWAVFFGQETDPAISSWRLQDQYVSRARLRWRRRCGRPRDLAGRVDIGFVEFAVAGDAEQREADADLVFDDLEEAHHALGAGGSEPADIEPAAGDRVGAEDQRLDVGPTADPAVDDDARAPADRLGDLRQNVDRADAL